MLDNSARDSQLADAYRSCHIFAVPAFHQAFFTVIEAMAFGKPVLASPLAADYPILQNGVHGFVVAPEDITGIVNALSRLLLDEQLYGYMRKSCLDQAARYSWDKCTDNLYTVYKDIIK